MNKTHDIHPALIVSFILVLGLTVGAAVSMEKFGFALGLDTTELEMEDLIPGRSDLLQPRNWIQIGGCDCRYRSHGWIFTSPAKCGVSLDLLWFSQVDCGTTALRKYSFNDHLLLIVFCIICTIIKGDVIPLQWKELYPILMTTKSSFITE